MSWRFGTESDSSVCEPSSSSSDLTLARRLAAAMSLFEGLVSSNHREAELRVGPASIGGAATGMPVTASDARASKSSIPVGRG